MTVTGPSRRRPPRRAPPAARPAPTAPRTPAAARAPAPAGPPATPRSRRSRQASTGSRDTSPMPYDGPVARRRRRARRGRRSTGAQPAAGPGHADQRRREPCVDRAERRPPPRPSWSAPPRCAAGRGRPPAPPARRARGRPGRRTDAASRSGVRPSPSRPRPDHRLNVPTRTRSVACDAAARTRGYPVGQVPQVRGRPVHHGRRRPRRPRPAASGPGPARPPGAARASRCAVGLLRAAHRVGLEHGVGHVRLEREHHPRQVVRRVGDARVAPVDQPADRAARAPARAPVRGRRAPASGRSASGSTSSSARSHRASSGAGHVPGRRRAVDVRQPALAVLVAGVRRPARRRPAAAGRSRAARRSPGRSRRRARTRRPGRRGRTARPGRYG